MAIDRKPIIWLTFLVLLPTAGQAGMGHGDSGAGALDARAPTLTLPVIPPGANYRGGETASFQWTFADLHPGAAHADHLARILVEGAAIDSLEGPHVAGPASWDWLVPELHSTQCYLTVAAGDAFGNRAEGTTERFSIMLSTTDAPPSLADGPAALRAPRPNPFNPATRVAYVVTAPGDVRLALYDARGRAVRQLAAGPRDAGEYEVAWDGTDDAGRRAAAGTYLLRLTWRGAGGSAERTVKVVMVP